MSENETNEPIEVTEASFVECSVCHGEGTVSATIAEQVQRVQKERLLSIFAKLMESKRFQDMVEGNFDIVDRIDDSTKTIETLVIEKPVAVGPKLTPQQIMQLQAAVSGSGVKESTSLMSRLLEILGQESSVILSAVDVPEELKSKLDA